jgi:hypothetical protein
VPVDQLKIIKAKIPEHIEKKDHSKREHKDTKDTKEKKDNSENLEK